MANKKQETTLKNEELVSVFIPRTSRNDTERFIAVNGERILVQTGKTVDLINQVDPAVLGGVRLDYDGKRVDGTVQNRLDTIGSLLKNTVL